jgi:replication factor C large subunit
MLTWVEKYRPQRVRDVVGNTDSLEMVMRWVDSWKRGVPKKKGLLLYGPAGVGKTSVAYAIANELGYDRIELNASDARTQDVIQRVVGHASTLTTLDPAWKRKIIIIDEVDGIHGKADYGGLRALMQAVRETRQPMILIANDPWKLSRDFRNLMKMAEFKRLDHRTIFGMLKEISSKEGIETDEKVLRIVATNSNGDLRSAINDLQALGEGRKRISLSEIDILSMRDSEIRIFDVLRRIFKTRDCDRAREAIWDSGEELDTLLKWIAENIPAEYGDKADMAEAFNYVSKADIFLGRIIRRQEWGLLRYAVDLMSAGVATSKKHVYRGFVPYRYPGIFALYARRRGEKALMDSAAAKIAAKVHCSMEEAREEYFPVLKIVMTNIEMGSRIASELGFTLEEVQYFVGEGIAKRVHNRAEMITKEKIRSQTHKITGTQSSLFEFETKD